MAVRITKEDGMGAYAVSKAIIFKTVLDEEDWTNMQATEESLNKE